MSEDWGIDGPQTESDLERKRRQYEAVMTLTALSDAPVLQAKSSDYEPSRLEPYELPAAPPPKADPALDIFFRYMKGRTKWVGTVNTLIDELRTFDSSFPDVDSRNFSHKLSQAWGISVKRRRESKRYVMEIETLPSLIIPQAPMKDPW
ncbi:MAG: hypothetical protein ABSB53_05105 [Nitrososphaerales archaeon]|jgi:hypothetical protein